MNAYVLAHLSLSACKHIKHIHRCRQTLKESWYLFLLIVVLFLCLPNIFELTTASQILQKICYNFTIKNDLCFLCTMMQSLMLDFVTYLLSNY